MLFDSEAAGLLGRKMEVFAVISARRTFCPHETHGVATPSPADSLTVFAHPLRDFRPRLDSLDAARHAPRWSGRGPQPPPPLCVQSPDFEVEHGGERDPGEVGDEQGGRAAVDPPEGDDGRDDERPESDDNAERDEQPLE